MIDVTAEAERLQLDIDDTALRRSNGEQLEDRHSSQEAGETQVSQVRAAKFHSHHTTYGH